MPPLLKKLTRPSAEMVTVTELGVGAWPATQLRLDDKGCDWSEGNTVRYDDAVGLIATTFMESPVAPDGMMQFPFCPHTTATKVSAEPTGLSRVPTAVAGRVSNNRHGVIGTNDDAVEPDADAERSPPPPINVAITAPSAVKRKRPA